MSNSVELTTNGRIGSVMCCRLYILSPRLSATFAEIRPAPVQQGSSRILVTTALPLTSLVRAMVTGRLLLLLELVSIANNSGPRDSQLKEYCPDQVDSSESMLELVARELRVDRELMLEHLLELIDRREPLLMES